MIFEFFRIFIYILNNTKRHTDFLNNNEYSRKGNIITFEVNNIIILCIVIIILIDKQLSITDVYLHNK